MRDEECAITYSGLPHSRLRKIEKGNKIKEIIPTPATNKSPTSCFQPACQPAGIFQGLGGTGDRRPSDSPRGETGMVPAHRRDVVDTALAMVHANDGDSS